MSEELTLDFGKIETEEKSTEELETISEVAQST